MIRLITVAGSMARNDTWLVLVAVMVLAIGSVLALTAWTAQQKDLSLREELLTKARIMERSIDQGHVENLSGTLSDLQSPDYRLIRAQLQQMRSADPSIRFAYIMKKRPDGAIIFLVDSEPESSGGYSPPGQIYHEATDKLESLFITPAEVTEGPVSDRWGSWISGLIPLVDPKTGEVVAVYGIDIEAETWNTQIILACIPIITGILVLLLLLLTIINIRQRDRHEREILAASAQALQESERRLYDIINFLPDPTFAIDLEGRVISWNRAIEEMTGVPAGEMLGKGDHEYAVPFYGERRPLLIDLISQPDEVIAKNYTNIIRDGDFLIADTALPRPKGRSMWLMGKAGPIYNRKGEVVGAIESIRDLTSRKEAEEALRTSEERFRILFQNVNDGIIVHEVAPAGVGRIIDVNDRACQILGYLREELIGRPLKDIHVPEPPALIQDILSRLRSEKRAIFDTAFFRKSGDKVNVEVSARLFEMEDRQMVLSAMRDITERKRAEEEKARYTAELRKYADALARTNSKLNLMNSITRHDILNQITAINGYLDLMNARAPDPEFLGLIRPALLASENIEQYIRFSKEYQDVGVRAPGWFTVRNLIESAASGLSLGPIRLIVDITDLQIFADPLVEKVFYTFMENALRHAKGLTLVRFACHTSGTGVVITCEDDGIGVPPQYKEKIFSRGYFLHTGYGLFLSREILGITGISIQETGEYKKGARFEIFVPEGAFRFNGKR